MDLVVPTFRAEQTAEHVILHVDVPACEEGCEARAAIDHGIFGVSCLHAHLPLVFAADALEDGSARSGNDDVGDAQASPSSSMEMKRNGSVLWLSIRKRVPHHHVEGLDTLKPSLFPIDATGDSQQNEQARLAGLEVLRHSVQVARQESFAEQTAAAEPTLASTSRLTAPSVGEEVRSRMHEYRQDPYAASHASLLSAALQREEEKWDEGMYLDSFVDEDGEIAHLLRAPLSSISRAEEIASKRTKTVISKHENVEDVQLLLLELLLAHAYDRRTTLGDPTVESAWTIAVLCRSLVGSCLPNAKEGDSVLSVLRGAFRRQLCYALYRSWQLSIAVVDDVVQTLRSGRHSTHLHVQQIRRLFHEGDDDALAVYVDRVVDPLLLLLDAMLDDALLLALSERVQVARQTITKSDVASSWELEALEEAAREAIRNGEGGFV